MTVYRVEQRLKTSESQKDRPRSERPQVINQEVIKKFFSHQKVKKSSKRSQVISQEVIKKASGYKPRSHQKGLRLISQKSSKRPQVMSQEVIKKPLRTTRK